MKSTKVAFNCRHGGGQTHTHRNGPDSTLMKISAVRGVFLVTNPRHPHISETSYARGF